LRLRAATETTLVFFRTGLMMKTLEKKPRTKMCEGGETFPLAKSLADELGDVPEGTPITLAMFRRVLFRLADLRSGKVHKPKPKLKPWKDDPALCHQN
jgi:hypothetical protein